MPDSLFKVGRRKVGISQGHSHVLVAQKLLDGPHICPTHGKIRSEGVSQVMEAKIFYPDFDT